MLNDDIICVDTCDFVKNLYCNNFNCFKNLIKNVEMNKKFKILALNVRSIGRIKKFDDFKLFLSEMRLEIDVIVLSEIWLEDNVVSLYNIDGYESHFSCRPDGYGGVAVYTRKSYKSQMNFEIKAPINLLEIELQITSRDKMTLIAIYRPPKDENYPQLESEVENRLMNIKSRYILLAGDVNIDMKRDLRIRQDYSELLNTFDLRVCNNEITRINDQSGSIIDHIATNITTEREHVTYTIESDLDTDHNAILTMIEVEKPIIEQEKRFKTYTNHEAIERDLRNLLNDHLWEEHKSKTEHKTVEEITSEILFTIQETMKRNKTTIEVKYNKKGECPWMTPEIIELVKKKNNMKRKIKRQPNEALKRRYKSMSEDLVKRKEQAKKTFYEKLFKKTLPMKRTWQNLNNILGRKNNGKKILSEITDTAGRNNSSRRFTKYF